MSALQAPKHTSEDLERLSARGFRYELVEGDLEEMSPTGEAHGDFGNALEAPASVYIRKHGLGRAYLAETGFLISRNPDTVLAPDWAFVAAARLPAQRGTRFMPVVPDLVLEVRSPGDRPGEIAAKVARWLNAGVRMLWDLDPSNRTVSVHRTSTPSRTLTEHDTLTGEDVLPGFELPLCEVFD